MVVLLGRPEFATGRLRGQIACIGIYVAQIAASAQTGGELSRNSAEKSDSVLTR
jgi:hypothetical protein